MLAHTGAPLGPHDVWTAWSFDPLTIIVLVGAAALYFRGRRRGDPRGRVRAFVAAVAVLVIALISPIDALADTLLTFHMVQHVLLVSVAAPLIGFADPLPVMRRGLGLQAQSALRGVRRTSRVDVDRVRQLRHPVGRFVFFVVSIWLWHSARLYDVAVTNRWVHVAEHAVFLAAALGVWSLLIGAQRHRADLGVAVALAFGVVLQGVALSALMVFARQPWYSVYASPNPAWGLDPLEDQHLAGLIMWFLGGSVFILAGVLLAYRWVSTSGLTSTSTPIHVS